MNVPISDVHGCECRFRCTESVQTKFEQAQPGAISIWFDHVSVAGVSQTLSRVQASTCSMVGTSHHFERQRSLSTLVPSPLRVNRPYSAIAYGLHGAAIGQGSGFDQAPWQQDVVTLALDVDVSRELIFLGDAGHCSSRWVCRCWYCLKQYCHRHRSMPSLCCVTLHTGLGLAFSPLMCKTTGSPSPYQAWKPQRDRESP
jgi:hypothetical protein